MHIVDICVTHTLQASQACLIISQGAWLRLHWGYIHRTHILDTLVLSAHLLTVDTTSVPQTKLECLQGVSVH